MRLRAACLLALLAASTIAAAREPVVIGVLSHRGDVATHAAWGPTAEYLSDHLPTYSFRIQPLDFDDVDATVQNRAVDFILVNSGIYVTLEVRYGVSRIATLNNRRSDDRRYNIFGGVIFTRADRTDLIGLEQLRGIRYAAVDPTSLGGHQMAWREMHALGIDPRRDFAELKFLKVHDIVVRDVLAGRFDAGTVRTDILERMVLDGAIEADSFRIINPQPQLEEFPFVRSTRLYPEWPFAKLRHTSNELAQAVAVQLLSMPRDHPAALAGRYAGWTVPLDYQAVHELFLELAIGPYAEPGRFTFVDVVRRYWYWFVLGVAALALMAVMVTWMLHLNQALERAKLGLEHRYELILNSVGEGIYGVDLAGRSTFANNATERITGWRAEELLGRSQHDMLHHTKADGSAHPREECMVYQTMQDGQPRQVEDLFWKKDGTSFPVEYTAAPIKDLKGETVGAVVVFRDVTERRRLEEDERQRQSELAHVARLSTMGEMATTIAHELNQPLSAISNYTSACVRMIDAGMRGDAELLKALHLVGNQSQRAGDIIRRIRNFIRKAGPAPEQVDINDLVREVVSLVGPEAGKQSIAIDLQLDDALPRIPAHAIEIEQVTLNLTRNAIEAMGDEVEELNGSRDLQIRTWAPDERSIQVSVRDRGHGLRDSAAKRVFTPFFTTKSTGMGLGLSISQRIIESHGGKLWATPNEDRGATFHFSLPIEDTARE